MRRLTALALTILFSLTTFLYLRNSVIAANTVPVVTICHFNGTSYEQSRARNDNYGGHFNSLKLPNTGHELDLLLQGEQNCPPVPTNIPTPTNFIELPCIENLCIPTIIIPTITIPTPGEGNESNGNINLPCRFQCPTVTPTVTPQPSTTPTSGPTPTDTPSSGGTGGPSSSSGGSTAGSSAPSQGQILGTNTLASTGAFADTVINLIALSGVLSLAIATTRYAKEKN